VRVREGAPGPRRTAPKKEPADILFIALTLAPWMVLVWLLWPRR